MRHFQEDWTLRTENCRPAVPNLPEEVCTFEGKAMSPGGCAWHMDLDSDMGLGKNSYGAEKNVRCSRKYWLLPKPLHFFLVAGAQVFVQDSWPPCHVLRGRALPSPRFWEKATLVSPEWCLTPGCSPYTVELMTIGVIFCSLYICLKRWVTATCPTGHFCPAGCGFSVSGGCVIHRALCPGNTCYTTICKNNQCIEMTQQFHVCKICLHCYCCYVSFFHKIT